MPEEKADVSPYLGLDPALPLTAFGLRLVREDYLHRMILRYQQGEDPWDSPLEMGPYPRSSRLDLLTLLQSVREGWGWEVLPDGPHTIRLRGFPSSFWGRGR